MYEIIRTVINSKKYDLSGLIKKIDTLWIQGEITDEQWLGLIDLARENAISENSIDLIEKLKSIEQEVKALKERIVALENMENEEDPEETPTEIPEYEPGKWYYTGDKVSFKGIIYVCIAPEGVVCVWSPAEYPAYWKKLEKVIEEPEESTDTEEIVEPQAE